MFVYILKSESSGKFYVGQTDRLAERLVEHNSGQSPSTRGRGPWILIYTEQFESRDLAVRREREIKSWKSARCVRDLTENLR